MSMEIAPQEAEVVEVVNATVAQARELTVATPEQARAAVEFLAHIADARRKNENARVFLVKPMNDHVKQINDRFKANAVPLDEADGLVRGKLLAFSQEEQRRLAAEQARIDMERRAREEAAEAERRRQAEEAAAAERQAREVEEARQAQLRQAENERAREIATMSDEELSKLAVGSETESDVRLAEQEMSARLTRREAEQRAAEARRLAEEAQQREISAKSAPATIATTTELSAGNGRASTRKRWVATVIDETRVPREYLSIDQKAINAAVKAGVREIPGVTIEQQDELAIRSSR